MVNLCQRWLSRLCNQYWIIWIHTISIRTFIIHIYAGNVELGILGIIKRKTNKMEPTKTTIDIARKLYNLPYISPELKASLEKDFPEVKESKDERARRELYAFISSVQHNYLCANSKREEWLTYLEKQKSVQSDTEKQYVRTLESLISDFLHGKLGCLINEFIGVFYSFYAVCYGVRRETFAS